METVNQTSGENSGHTSPSPGFRNCLHRLHDSLRIALPLLDTIAGSFQQRTAKRVGEQTGKDLLQRLRAAVEDALREAKDLEKMSEHSHMAGQNAVAAAKLSEAIEDAFAMLYCTSTAISDAMYEEGSWGANALARGLTVSVDGMRQLLKRIGVIGVA